MKQSIPAHKRYMTGAFKPLCGVCGTWHWRDEVCSEDDAQKRKLMRTYGAVYQGPTEKLHGLEALVRQDPDNQFQWLAQFNGYNVDGSMVLFMGGVNLASGWHPFPKSSFSVY